MGGKDAPSRCRYNKAVSSHWHVSPSHCPPPCLDSTIADSFITGVDHSLLSTVRSGPNPWGVLTLCFSKLGSNCFQWGGLVKQLLSRSNVLGWGFFFFFKRSCCAQLLYRVKCLGFKSCLKKIINEIKYIDLRSSSESMEEIYFSLSSILKSI